MVGLAYSVLVCRCGGAVVEEIKAALVELFPTAEFEVRLDGENKISVSYWEGALALDKVEACVARVSGLELKETADVPFGEYGIQRIHVINTFA